MGKRRGVLKKKEVEKPRNHERADYIFQTMNQELQDKALLAAEAHIFKLEKEGKMDEPIFLQLTTMVQTSKSKEFTRRMIKIPNRLRTVKNTTILLVTKDPVDTYRVPLTDKEAVTSDTFTDIVGYKKFKTMVGTSKKALKTYHEYDMIITDNRLHSLLPKLLEPTIFCKSSQKFPLMLQMAKPDPDAQLVKTKKSGFKDERVEPEYVQGQIKLWCRNTTFVPSTGPVISIIVGNPKLSGSEIIENIDSVLTYLCDESSRPIGGIVQGGFEGILDMHLRANDKTLPIMKKS